MVSDLIKLKNEINNLNNYEVEEIKNIINRHSLPYTKNNNGIFINMNDFTHEIISDLKNFINFSKKSRKILENKSREIDNEKKHINSLIRNNKLPFNVKVKDIDDEDEVFKYKKEYQKILKSSFIKDNNIDIEKDNIETNKLLSYYSLSKGKKMNQKMKFNGLKEKILKSLKEKKKKRIHSIDLIISSLIQLNNEECIRKKTKRRRRKKNTKKKIIKQQHHDLMDDVDDVDDVDGEDIDNIIINSNENDVDDDIHENEDEDEEDDDDDDDEDEDDDDDDDDDDEEEEDDGDEEEDDE